MGLARIVVPAVQNQEQGLGRTAAVVASEAVVASALVGQTEPELADQIEVAAPGAVGCTQAAVRTFPAAVAAAPRTGFRSFRFGWMIQP